MVIRTTDGIPDHQPTSNPRFMGATRVTLGILGCAISALLLIAPATGQVTRQDAAFPTIVDPETAGDEAPVTYEVLRGDFHMHTTYSDGLLSPAERVVEAWQYGYDVIAITDHRNFQAYEEARPMAEALDLLLLRGMETGLDGQEHVVALDFSADYVPRNPHAWAETEGQSTVFYQDQWNRLAAAGGFVLYAHPHVGLRETMLWGIEQGLLGGIEVKNDVVGNEWNTAESYGTWWYPFGFDWAVEYNLTIFANSDVHEPRGDQADQAVTLVLADERSCEGVVEALHAGRTVACFNKMLCAHERILDLLMPSLVGVRTITPEGGTTALQLQNYGPLELKAKLTGTPLATMTLGPYQSVLVSLRRLPDPITVTWTNVYTDSTSNLVTTYPVTARSR